MLTERAVEKKVTKGKLKRQYKRYKEKKANKAKVVMGGMVDTSSSKEEDIDSSPLTN